MKKILNFIVKYYEYLYVIGFLSGIVSILLLRYGPYDKLITYVFISLTWIFGWIGLVGMIYSDIRRRKK